MGGLTWGYPIGASRRSAVIRLANISKNCNALLFLIQATQVIPGQVTYSNNCENVPYTTYESYTETINDQVQSTVNDCSPSYEPQCHNYNSPTYQVENVTQTETVQIPIEECVLTDVNDQVKLHNKIFVIIRQLPPLPLVMLLRLNSLALALQKGDDPPPPVNSFMSISQVK